MDTQNQVNETDESIDLTIPKNEYDHVSWGEQSPELIGTLCNLFFGSCGLKEFILERVNAYARAIKDPGYDDYDTIEDISHHHENGWFVHVSGEHWYSGGNTDHYNLSVPINMFWEDLEAMQREAERLAEEKRKREAAAKIEAEKRKKALDEQRERSLYESLKRKYEGDSK